MTNLTKDSGIDWIGKIPANWEVKRIKDVSKIKKGKAVETFLEKSEEMLPCIDTNFLRGRDNIVYCNNGTKVSSDKVLILWDGANAGELFFNEKIGYLGSTFGVFNTKINNKFWFYYLKGIEQYSRDNLTGMGVPHVDGNVLKQTIALIPSKEQQTAIANYLDQETSKIDRKISILEQKYEKLEEYKQSVIFETVTKGLDSSVQMKDSGIDWIGDIPKHWEVLRLKSIYNYKNGYAFSDNDYSKEPNGNYLIKITNVTENGIQEDETFCIEVNETTKKFKIKENSILYALSGATAGKCCFLDKTEKNFYLNQRVAQMQLKNGINKYFYYLICNKVFANLLLNLYPQTAQPNIGKNDLDNSYVPFVSNLIEQNKIVDYLDTFTSQIDKKVEIIKKQIDLLKEYKQTIIYEAVTGKMEIL